MQRKIKILVITGLLIAAGCSTERNTLLTRTYHNLTAHYNIYYNGNQSFNAGLKRIENSYQENYTRLLPVFYYSIPSVSEMVTPDMQRAIEKATKVIALHSITAKPDLKRGPQTDKQKEFYNKKEYNKWIDDNLVLMGKAYIYKNEFNVAVETLRRVVRDFPNEPIRFEALIWMARAYNEIAEYREANRILTLLKGEEDLPEEYKGLLRITEADYHLKHEEYLEAIPKLEASLEFNFDKHYRTRYTYLLAQLYQETGQSAKAVNAYRQVVRMNPPYEMTFSARINMASAYSVGSGRAEEIESDLRKMLKDDKNIDYQDQIYYALGNISLKQGNEDEAIEYYRQSVRANTNNLNAKGLSYMALGDIYYEKPEYASAQAYYDSTLQNIDQRFDDFEELSNKARSLNNLVQHLQIYEREDSLQYLAQLPESERMTAIDIIIENVRKEEQEERERQQEQAMDRQYGMMMSAQNNRNTNTTQGGNWYFYNMNAKSFGEPEFRMKWGNRNLEDNWRRKNKQSIDIMENVEAGIETDTASGDQMNILDNKSREFYLKDIPMGDSAMRISDRRLEEALYNMAIVYRDQLRDTTKAISAFAELIERYSNGNYGVLAFYNLYDLHNLQGNQERAGFYKNQLINRYPDNPRAKILANPEYVQQIQEERNRANDFYEETYIAYHSGYYNTVIGNVDKAIKEFEGHKTLPKYRLLKALAVGKTSGKAPLKDALEDIIADYPNHEVSDYSRAVIEEIYSSAPEIQMADIREEAEQLYFPDSTATFYIGLTAGDTEEINQLNFNLINFNLDHFSQQTFGIIKETIDETNVLFVSSFEGHENASRYLNALRINTDEVFRDVNPASSRIFLITEENYNTLKIDNNLQRYLIYFENQYRELSASGQP